VDVEIEVKAPSVVQAGGGAASETAFDLGGNTALVLSTQVQRDGGWEDMAEGFPDVAANGNKLALTVRLPKPTGGGLLLYDPIVRIDQPSDDESDAGSSDDPGAEPGGSGSSGSGSSESTASATSDAGDGDGDDADDDLALPPSAALGAFSVAGTVGVVVGGVFLCATCAFFAARAFRRRHKRTLRLGGVREGATWEPAIGEAQGQGTRRRGLSSPALTRSTTDSGRGSATAVHAV